MQSGYSIHAKNSHAPLGLAPHPHLETQDLTDLMLLLLLLPQVRCNKPCPKLCARERHPCPRMCWQPCGRCEVEEEEVALPCGHTACRVPCYE